VHIVWKGCGLMAKRLSGDELRAWARGQAAAYIRGGRVADAQSLEFLITETYLQGAVDALKEEVDFLHERGLGGQRQP